MRGEGRHRQDWREAGHWSNWRCAQIKGTRAAEYQILFCLIQRAEDQGKNFEHPVESWQAELMVVGQSIVQQIFNCKLEGILYPSTLIPLQRSRKWRVSAPHGWFAGSEHVALGGCMDRFWRGKVISIPCNWPWLMCVLQHVLTRGILWFFFQWRSNCTPWAPGCWRGATSHLSTTS